MGHTKGKNIVEYHSPNEQGDSEEDLPQPERKRQRKSKKGGTSKSTRSKPKAPPKITPARRIQILKDFKLEPTRWADHEVLEKLGIFGEVKRLFLNMGLGGLFNMEEVTHEEETSQFLATLVVSRELDNENQGRIDFKIHGKPHSITMEQLGMLFHFPTGGEVVSLVYDHEEVQGVWELIADGTYDKGKSKNTSIRHPAIRYAHKLLASTLFARKEVGNVLMEELLFIIEGLKPYLVTLENGKEIIGQQKPVNFPLYLAMRFLYYQEYIVTTRDKAPEIGIGGLITPILKSCGVEIKKPKKAPVIVKLDAPHLATTKFLAGRIKGNYCYKFKLGEEYKAMILPNVAHTTLEERNRIFFKPAIFLLYNSTRDGRMQTVKSRETAPRQTVAEDEESPAVYGSKRYDFAPYEAPVTGNALRAAHERIDILQRFIKWQGKQIRNVVKTVKRQNEKIKKQGRKIKELLTASTSGSPSSPTDSSSSSRGTRQAKGKAPLSPSTSGSGNYDYSLDYSSSSPSREF